MSFLLLLVTGLWLLVAILATWNARAARKLPALDALPLPNRPPRVSVVVAGRNEESRIEETVRGLLRQQGVDLQIVVVDDRSTDLTPAILARLAAEHSRLTTLRVDELPTGWLGKCHAMAEGASQATGDWILFTDADIHMRPDLIARAVATARRDGVQHLCLWPGLNCDGPFTRAIVLGFSQCLSIYSSVAAINADRGRRAMGVGAFNLVERNAYRAIGGHEPLRLEVVDDVKLGLLLRRAGFRQRIYLGFEELEAEWAHSVAQVIRAIEKNWFAGVNYSPLRGASVILLVAGTWLLAALGPLVAAPLGWLALAALWSTALPALLQARQAGWPWYVAVLSPFAYLVFAIAGVYSMAKTLRQGGVRWRDTFYPLAELRAGLVRW